jgi:hypothetical protein
MDGIDSFPDEDIPEHWRAVGRPRAAVSFSGFQFLDLLRQANAKGWSGRSGRASLRDTEPAPGPKKTKAQRFLAKPLFVLVGRVGIDPTTNELLEGYDTLATAQTVRPFRRRKSG